MFDIAGQTMKPVSESRSSQELNQWWDVLNKEARAKKASESLHKSMTSTEIEALARSVFEEVSSRAVEAGVALPQEYILRLIGELSGMGPLLELIARSDIEDIAINLGHIHVYTTGNGWEHAGAAPDGIGDALRVMIDRAGQRAPTPDYPIADAMLQVMVPLVDGTVRRKGVRINYVMPPASPYGDTITLRISNYRTASDLTQGSLALLCQNRLPPIPRPKFDPKDFPRGDGILTPEAANYLLSVMVHGGTLVIAGTTGSGKTFVGQRILQEMLDYYPRGAIRLFIVEDSNEIILNGWNGDGKTDTGNIIYTVTRPEIRGGPPPVTMYDLIRSALRSRPHGVVIGEARGAEAWELIRAAATGHGHSAFTIHATSAEHVWPRFLQVVQAHPDAARMSEIQIAQSFAEAVTAAVYIERNPQHGQIVREIVEVSTVVERTAARPSFSPLFKYEAGRGLVPTGNRPMRHGFRAKDLNIPETIFKAGVVMAEQTIGSTRTFVLAKGFTRVGDHSALIGEDDTKRLFAEVYADPDRPDVRPQEAYQAILSSMQPGWTLRLLQLFWPDPEPRLEFQKQASQWKRPDVEGLDILHQGLILAVQEYPLPFVRRTVLEFVLPGDEGIAWWEGLSGLCAGFGLRIRYLDQNAIEGLTRWVLNLNLTYQ